MNDKIHEPEIIDVEITDEDHSGASLIRASESWPPHLRIFPLSNRPLFPGLIVPLVYEGEEMKQAVHKLVDLGQNHVGLILVRDEDGPLEPKNFYGVGVIARVVKAVEINGHGLHLVVECLERFRVKEWLEGTVALSARVEYFHATDYEDNVEMRAYTVAIINTIKELLKHNPLYEEELRFFSSRFSTDEPARLADFAAGLTTADRTELQDVLETYPIFERMKKVITLLNRELSVSKTQTRIRENIQERVSEQQRKFFLNEQLHEIKRELGLNTDPQEQEIEKLKKLASRLTFSEEAQGVFEEEMEKLGMLDPSSPEYGVTRNYLDWMVSLPWGLYARDRFNLKA
ncbi:MAG: endopeptidase La, partial [Mariprofundaceae bacterium]|nr:endopeptidase La [Mariprofundaceae bacterium]